MWIDALPNLLIGLREGLEAGLVVSILLAAVRKLGAGERTWPVWLGVLGAVSLAGSFAAVLTFSSGALGSQAQQAVGGILSVIAVVLVTLMIFWMRRTARSLSSEIRRDVGAAAGLGAGALAVTAFTAIAREGLESTLFIWTSIQASGSTVAPVVGAFVGIALAVLLCWLMFRGAVRMNLGVFFSRTAIALIVIAAGILAYGLGDLQDAGLLPGGQWVAFDLSGHAWTGSWWATLIQGLTQLRPRMSVLQVVAWVVYLALVLGRFLREGARERAASSAAAAGRAAGDVSAPAAQTAPAPRPAHPAAWLRWVEKRVWLVAAGLVALPALIAAAVIVALPAQASGSTAVHVTATACGTGWSSGTTGRQTFAVSNEAPSAVEITLRTASGAVVGEIETLGPGTTSPLTTTLASGSYAFHCLFAGQPALDGAAVQVSGAAVHDATAAVAPASIADLAEPNNEYQWYAYGKLGTLQTQLKTLRAAAAAGDAATARRDWLAAMLTWEQVGASYNSFGALGQAVDGLPTQFEGGAQDPGFTGLHRVEHDLWHGASRQTLVKDIDVTVSAVAKVRASLGSLDLAGDPTNLPLRAHEILEDALRDHLMGTDDGGSGASFALTDADVQVTRVVLGELAPVLTPRSPQLVATANAQLDTLQGALQALRRPDGTWVPLGAATLAQRQAVDSAIGAALETLSAVPTLLELPPSLR
ncbi:MAG: FTR1 family protein [Microbacteriaceae bacterium]|nr:FTR1 family protein [Microbacteriaceae bacterium]MCL2795930.1 FTR1 family protein [Microbacteriaceae bacterium]